MNADDRLDERLLEPLLREVDAAQDEGPGEHPDEETLAMFAEGTLEEAPRAEVVRHLAECPQCRRAAGWLLSVSSRGAEVVRRPRLWQPAPRGVVWLAAAAALLLMVGLLWWLPEGGVRVAENRVYSRASRLLGQRQFDAVRQSLREAAEQGIESDRLRSLEAQAVLEIDHPIGLAAAGQLSDFGFEIGGVAPRSAAPAEEQQKRQTALAVLRGTDSAEPEIQLNRGHVLLLLDQPEEALAEFRELTARHPDRPLAWLGRGIAQFMLEDFESAEESFRQCLRQDPEHTAAKINLAMTLEEQGKLEEALALWESLPKTALSPDERQQIDAEIRELRKHLPP
jgi:tetratricopeptide (TPR) repeat protein